MLDLAGVVQQIDELFNQNRGKDAEELMKQTIVQAVEEEDDNALLTMLNELIGYYREASRVEASYQLADQALQLLAQMGLEGTIPYATTLLNIANAYRAGGRLEDSLACYRKTKAIYEKLLAPDDMLVASFYNNMSLLYQEMQQHREAKLCLQSALSIVSGRKEAYYELAATYTNLASTCLELNEDDEAEGYFRQAIMILEEHGIDNAHYSAALSSLGTYYYKKGAYEEAAVNFRKAMDCMKRSLGENEFYQRLKENLEACEKAMPKSVETERVCKGLELSRAYYEAYGRPMLETQFGDWLDRIAVGLAGEGSDCFGYDDAISRDHDWGPDFCIWITEETDREIGEALRQAYAELPEEFMGYRRNVTQGEGRRGVQTINGFYSRLLGEQDWERIAAEELSEELSEGFWQQVSDAALAAGVNGEVYADPEGCFSAVRRKLQEGYPERIRLLKLAESVATFSQSGQYNLPRVLKRGDQLTAQILLGDCLRAAARICYYAANQYPPHDKWLLKGLEALEEGRKIKELLERVGQAAPMMGEQQGAEEMAAAIEEAAKLLAQKLYRAGMISEVEAYLDHHTPELLLKAGYAALTDEELVERIVKLEYTAFDKVHNVGGRAFCQDDWRTFSIMRRSQYLTFTRPMLMQYLYDFEREYQRGHNLIEEKYGRMMESTAPQEYESMKHHFPEISAQKKAVIEAIVALQVGWMEEFEENYPTLAGNARSIHTEEDHLYNTSYETYLRGEISTYSDKMLELYGRYVVDYARAGHNLTYDIMGHSVRMYGYQDLDSAEKYYAPPESVCQWRQKNTSGDCLPHGEGAGMKLG